MTWLNNLLNRAKETRAQSTISYPTPIFLQRGKWVKVDGKVGIITDTSSGNVIGIDHTDEVGATTHTKYYPVGQVQIAKLMDIPGPRRPIDRDQATSLGYY
jgi:hypothetical protein